MGLQIYLFYHYLGVALHDYWWSRTFCPLHNSKPRSSSLQSWRSPPPYPPQAPSTPQTLSDPPLPTQVSLNITSAAADNFYSLLSSYLKTSPNKVETRSAVSVVEVKKPPKEDNSTEFSTHGTSQNSGRNDCRSGFGKFISYTIILNVT